FHWEKACDALKSIANTRKNKLRFITIKITKIVPIYDICRTHLIYMKLYILLLLWLAPACIRAQTKPPTNPTTLQPPPSVPTTIPQMKAELEKSPNPLLYPRDILKKRFRIDTIIVSRTHH